MPELPEVETVRRSLLALVGQRIQAVEVFEPRLRRLVIDDFARRLSGRRIQAIERRGKYLLFHLEPSIHVSYARRDGPERSGLLRAGGGKPPASRTEPLALRSRPLLAASRRAPARDNPHPALPQEEIPVGGEFILAHLGMTGALLLQPPHTPRQPHDHVRFHLSSGAVLTYNDPRRFGLLRLVGADGCAELGNVGPDPLSPNFSVDDLAALTRKSKRPVKNLLMDQRALGGIGNIYANEILFAAGIRPSRRAHRLTRSDLRRLLRATRVVLGAAIRLGGSSISDYRDGDGRPGYFQLRLCVYDRAGEPCRRCHMPVRRTVHAGRSSFYCPTCQR